MTTATSSLQDMVRQVRGKAFAHLHQRQIWPILMQGNLEVAVPLKRGNVVDQCANSAKAAVKDLGFALYNSLRLRRTLYFQGRQTWISS